MRKALLFLIIHISLTNLLSQSKRDYTWVVGYSTLIPNMPNNAQFSGMFLNFNQSPPSIKEFDIFTIGVSGVANDEDGILQFYTSGCQIFNKNSEVMEGGDDIIMGGAIAEENCSELYGALLNLWGSTMILPVPESDSKYLVFQMRLDITSDGLSIWDKFFYSEVDMSANDGLGQVVKKKQVVLSDSLHDAVTAVRHGNGRDWWIVVPRGTERQFWEILLTPDGVKDPILRTLPNQAPFTLTTKGGDPPFTEHPINEYNFEAWAGQANFSPDGSKYCRIVCGNGVEIFDFDRCSGEMKFRRDIPMPPDENYIRVDRPVQGCGLAVSPNNRYLYFNNNLGLFQFDLREDNIEKGDYTFVEYYNYFFEDSTFATDFFHMHNAPDGKIYANSKSSVRSLHVIHEPNRYGSACNFEQRGLKLPKWNGSLLSYFPNFRLYDVADSSCDTLGIDDPFPPAAPVTFDEFWLFPNPAAMEVMVYLPQSEGARLTVWNIAGQLTTDIPYIPGQEVYALDVSDWPSGTYVLAAYIGGEKLAMKRLVVVH